MEELKDKGKYRISETIAKELKDFYSGYGKEAEGSQSIFQTYKETGYVLDPHTAVAKVVADHYAYEQGRRDKCLVVSTASPYKFSQTVLKAWKEPVPKDVFEGIEALEKLWKEPIPAPVKEVEEGEIRHSTVCSVEDMEATVSHFLLS